MVRYTWVVLLFVFAVCANTRDAVVLHDSNKVFSAGTSLYYFEDTTGVLQFEDIIGDETVVFEKPGAVVPNLGFTRSAVWLCLDIVDPSPSRREWIVDIAMPALHRVEFFLTSGDSLIRRHLSGLAVDRVKRATPYRNPSLDLGNLSRQTKTLYARVESQTSVILPVFIREKNTYIGYDRLREFLLGLYFGVLLIMVIYNFYLYIATADRSYLWLVLFTACYGLGQLSAVYGFLTEWGFTGIDTKLHWLHVINYLAAFFAIMVSRDMVHPWKYAPRCDLVLRGLLFTTMGLALFSPLMSFMAAEKILVLVNILPLPFFIYSALAALRKKHRPALYYLLATTSFITGIAAYNLMYGFDLLPFNEVFYFIPNMTFIITLALFSLGVADKLNSLKKEREQAREKALAHLNETVRIQKEKASIEHELEHARKMETIGRLLSGVSHDMINLISPVQGYANLLIRRARGDKRTSLYANRLIEATGRLKDLAMTLVNVSRKKARELNLIDLNSATDQVVSLLCHSAPKTVNITFVKAFESPVILADMGMVHSAVLNLGINAVDAIQGKGRVRIETAQVELPSTDTLLRRFDITQGHYAAISVTDTGMGIAENELKRIFEPFYTTKTDGKGTGLGLAGVYNCMRAHAGAIGIQSEAGKGTKITLYFPTRESFAESHETVLPSETDSNVGLELT